MVMKNKKGWIRLVEVLVVILLIMGFAMILINPVKEEKDIASRIYLAENSILREIQLNNTYRDYILTIETSVEFQDQDFPSDLKEHISKRIPAYLECKSKICDFETDPICDMDLGEKNIYVRSVMIAANESKYEPKEIKLFCWTA